MTIQDSVATIEIEHKGALLFAIVDAADAPFVAGFRWHISGGYPETWTEEGKSVRLHRLLLPAAAFIDHRNRNPLDNRRSNLRAASKQENARNSKMPVTNKSGVRGVHFSNPRQRWIAKVKIDGKEKYLGAFVCLEDAEAASNAAREGWLQ